MSFSVNILAVVVAVVANMVLGMLWYSKALFAKQWLKLIGKSEAQLKGAQQAMGLAVLVSLVEAYFLAVLINNLGANTLLGGAKVGGLVWLGFIATTMLNEVIFEGRSSKLYQIQVGYQLVSFVIMGALLAVIH